MFRSVAMVLSALALAITGCPSESAPGPSGDAGPAAPAVAPSLAVPGDAEKEAAAIEAAEAWLALLDSEQYAKSWEEAAGAIKAAVTPEDWEKTSRNLKSSMGKVISRELQSQQYATSLPGAPDGQYVVIQYNTRFQNKQAAVETITPMLEKDGTWRVSGYYVK